MSAEFNKVLCAILSAILVLMLSSFISELLYHPKKSGEKISYLIKGEEVEEKNIPENAPLEVSVISSEDINELLAKANLEAGEKFVAKKHFWHGWIDIPFIIM